ncbi:MAG: hypothetical protein H7A45_20815 [Verrucomicrobiales bacterium]|nr:hypothetical protein [Verrucomicrobiales bacterium]MCP5527044.1 hypothetical protein [Verrucomicrobiales bacterium]
MLQPPDHEDRLRRLLSLKRYECPPPGFFEQLPRQIRLRIERECRPRPSLTAWWRRLCLEWDLKPALAGAALIAAGGVYFFTLPSAEQSPSNGAGPATLAGSVLPSTKAEVGAGLLAEANPYVADTNASPSLRARGYQPPPAGLFQPGFRLQIDRAAYESVPAFSGLSNAARVTTLHRQTAP